MHVGKVPGSNDIDLGAIEINSIIVIILLPPRVVGPRLWNALPISIKCCGTLSAFRKALKTHIFKLYYC